MNVDYLKDLKRIADAHMNGPFSPQADFTMTLQLISKLLTILILSNEPPTLTVDETICPKCRAKLVDTNPGMMLLSNPPTLATNCPKCDFKGYRRA